MARMENTLESIRATVAAMAEEYEATMAEFLKLKTKDGICFDLSEVIPEINLSLVVDEGETVEVLRRLHERLLTS